MPGQLESLTDEIQLICDEIGGAVEEGYAWLIERRDEKIEAEYEPLDAEAQLLRQEHASLEQAACSLQQLLPAKAREAQRRADEFLIAGQPGKAQAKIEEQQEAEAAPGAMRQRQSEISARLEALGEQQKVIARRAFETWYAELQQIVRAAEHALFCELLDKSREEMYVYQDRHGLGASLAQPYSSLIRSFHLENLTANERSAEWTAGCRWYGVR